MKKILLILLLTIISLDAKSCMTDIYFGNGVWNDSDSAEKNMLKLRRHMHNRAFTPLDREKEGEGGDYNFKYTHNPSHGTIYDLIETFWQLKESEQITEQDFHSYYAGLLSSRDGKHYHERLQQIINTYNADINTMLNQYIDSSFSQKHNVLLVAHSQGNLFGNKIYTLLSDAQKKKFRMVSVATPANHVMEENQISPYVTASGDLVIKSIPRHLDANVDGIGHAFIGTYLHSSFGARTKIAHDVKSAYDDLMQTTSCGDGSYSYYVWIGYQCPTRSAQELVIDIYGRPSDSYKKQLVTSDNRIRMPYEIINGNKVCTVYGNDRLSLWPEYNKGDCYAYSLADNHPAGWLTLDTIASTTYNNHSTCTGYQMSSEIADSLSSMLP